MKIYLQKKKNLNNVEKKMENLCLWVVGAILLTLYMYLNSCNHY